MACLVSVGRTRLFTLSSNANSVTLCVQSSVPVRTARAGCSTTRIANYISIQSGFQLSKLNSSKAVVTVMIAALAVLAASANAPIAAAPPSRRAIHLKELYESIMITSR